MVITLPPIVVAALIAATAAALMGGWLLLFRLGPENRKRLERWILLPAGAALLASYAVWSAWQREWLHLATSVLFTVLLGADHVRRARQGSGSESPRTVRVVDGLLDAIVGVLAVALMVGVYRFNAVGWLLLGAASIIVVLGNYAWARWRSLRRAPG